MCLCMRVGGLAQWRAAWCTKSAAAASPAQQPCRDRRTAVGARAQILRGEMHPEEQTPFATVEHSEVDKEDYFFHLYTGVKGKAQAGGGGRR